MATMRDIKRRRSSVQSIQQITKAMKLVATVKLQRAKAEADRSWAYSNCMFEAVNNILSHVGQIHHEYLTPGGSGKKAVIAITSNRGLAGGYSSNIVKLVTGMAEGEHKVLKDEMAIYAIGTKGRDAFHRAEYDVRKDISDILGAPVYADAVSICEGLLKEFREGEVCEIYLAYTSFKSTISNVPVVLKLLPVAYDTENAEKAKTAQKDEFVMNFEPSAEEVMDILIPKYITSVIFGALKEAVASENSARMRAMESATSNADDMIDDLALMYNRARQSSITQELTEIIAGSEAIS